MRLCIRFVIWLVRWTASKEYVVSSRLWPASSQAFGTKMQPGIFRNNSIIYFFLKKLDSHIIRRNRLATL